MSSQTFIDEIIKECPEALIFPLGSTDILGKVIEALSFKGGEASVNSLKIATLLEDEVLKQGLHSGTVLKLLEKDKEESDLYLLTELGEHWLNEAQVSKKSILGENLLVIDPILDLVYRMKNAPDKCLKIGDVSSALYIILGNAREEIRKQILRSFIDFGVYANLFENIEDNANPRLKITSTGEKLFDAFQAKKRAKRKGGAGAVTVPSGSSAHVDTDLTCAACGNGIRSDYNLCPYCGVALKRSCSNCGKELQPGWKMCPFCGTPN